MTTSDELRMIAARLRELAAEVPSPEEISYEWPGVLSMTRECVERVAGRLEGQSEDNDLRREPQAPAEVVERAREDLQSLRDALASCQVYQEDEGAVDHLCRTVSDFLMKYDPGFAAEPKPCPHEDAEWKIGSVGGYWRWMTKTGARIADAESRCPDCGEKLPPVPRPDPEDMSAEEWAIGKRITMDREEPMGSYMGGYRLFWTNDDGEREGVGAPPDPITACQNLAAAVRAPREHQEAETNE